MNQHAFQRRPTNNSAIPTVIFALLVANGLLFAAQQLQFEFLLYNFALWPAGSPRPEFHVWQLLSYGFLHGDLNHIFFNMFGLWMFGRDIERMMGARRFLIYYLTCVIGAGIVQLLVAGTQGGIYPTIGASGGVFGILLAFAMAFPNRVIMLLFPPIPMKAKYFVLMYGLLELYLGLSGRAPGVANFAHLGGMFFGFLLIQYWRKARRK
ncbi:MAG: rhomboid family intramembrane serine protease [Woeseiaceae bacterium]